MKPRPYTAVQQFDTHGQPYSPVRRFVTAGFVPDKTQWVVRVVPVRRAVKRRKK